MAAVEIKDPQVEKDSTTVSMVVGKSNVLSELSSIHHISGFPWRLRLHKRDDGKCELFVRCEKSMEAELWVCDATVRFKLQGTDNVIKCMFESRDKSKQEVLIGVYPMFAEGTLLEVNIKSKKKDGISHNEPTIFTMMCFICTCRPTVDFFAPRDGILVVGGKKIYVNKESLATQSPFFDRLFNANFKEKNMAEVPIEDVEYEEFTTIMRMIYGENGSSAVKALLTRDNVHRVLELADRFDLRIVIEGVINVLLSASSPFSIHQRLLIVDQHNLPTDCKVIIISQYKDAELKELSESPEYDQLSEETKKALFKRATDRI